MDKIIIKAKSTVTLFGGKAEDYLSIHEWFDETETWVNGPAHQSFRHHTQGIFEAEAKFGPFIVNSDGKKVPTRVVCELHIEEDLGFIPTPQEWMEQLTIQNWMGNRDRFLAQELRRTYDDDHTLGQFVSKKNMPVEKTS